MSRTSDRDGELQQRLRQQEVVATLGQQALETDDLDQLMHDASVAVAETLDNEYCKVLELLPGGDEVFLRQGIGWHAGLVGTATVPTDLDSQAGYTLISEEPVIVEELATEERFSGPDLLIDHDVVSGISVIIGSVQDPWGILGTHTTDRREFTDHDATFVKNVANVLGSAIENERTKQRLSDETEIKEQIVDTSPVGIVIVGGDGTIDFANERAEEIYGREQAELKTFSHDDPRWDPIDTDGNPIPESEMPHERVTARGEPVFDMDLGLTEPNGERVWVTVNGAPLPEPDDHLRDGQTVDRAVFAFDDVTEKRRLEGEFKEILGRISDAFYALDTEFRFTHVNNRAEELLHYDESALLGERLWDVFPSAAEIDEVWDAFHTARDTQEATSYELYYETLDFWVEANIYPSDSGLSVYFRDVSDRVQRETELERTERRFQAIFEDPNILVGLLDPSGTVLDVNDTAMEYVNASTDEVTGAPVWETPWWDDDVVDDVATWTDRAADGEYVEFETDLTKPNGDTYTLKGVFRPVTNENGDVVSILVTDRDITERREYQRRLETSNQRLEKFAYAASHDLQEPLRMVSSYLQLIERRYEDQLDTDGQEFLAYAVDGADRMREMIEALLAYSRVESRGDPFESVDLETVFADVMTDLQLQVEERGARIDAGTLPTVKGDPNQLRQVLQNLLSNAITYSENGPPSITVTAEEHIDEWVLSVGDDGIGIPEADTERVFEVFQRLHTQEEHEGTGIGLALCKRIVERHGGDMWVDAEPGEGSTFFFSIPKSHTD